MGAFRRTDSDVRLSLSLSVRAGVRRHGHDGVGREAGRGVQAGLRRVGQRSGLGRSRTVDQRRRVVARSRRTDVHSVYARQHSRPVGLKSGAVSVRQARAQGHLRCVVRCADRHASLTSCMDILQHSRLLCVVVLEKQCKQEQLVLPISCLLQFIAMRCAYAQVFAT